ncbi:MAG: sulfur carrier protein ThiS [Pseudomonadota bacterium]
MSSQITISVNGESRDFAATANIDDIVREIAVRGRYAVEVNGEILPKSHHSNYTLKAGDIVEVVQAIGGG